FPRTGKIDFYSFSFSFGEGNWNKSFRSAVSTVGFSEEVRLGSLGTVLPYHREIMNVRMVKNLSRKIPYQEEAVAQEVPYNEIKDKIVYFRGMTVYRYEQGTWSSRKMNPSWMSAALPEEIDSPTITHLSLNYRQPPADESEQLEIAPFYRPGAILPPETAQQLFFDDTADLISLHLKIQPLDTNIFFAPYPFFFRAGDRNIRTMPFANGSIREARRRSRVSSPTIFSTAFKNGNQLPLTPNQERIYRHKDDLLQVPDSGIEKLTATAKRWDAESSLPPDDIIGRAIHIESKFLYSDRFKYQLGGITRKYGVDPLEDFVSSNPSGHCEYFSGALCLMLRVNGIASRVVIGYKTPVERLNNGTFTVRQSDAHTWVEVYVPPELMSAKHNSGLNSEWWKNGGWLRLDPTPPLPEKSLLKEVTFTFAKWSEWFKKMWNDYVIDMNPQRQTLLFYQPLQESGIWISQRVFNLSFWKETLSEIGNYYRNLFFSGHKTVKGYKDYFLIMLPFIILLLFFALLFRYIKPLLRLLNFTGITSDRQNTSVDFYHELEKTLQVLAPKRKENETPLEYVSKTTKVLNILTDVSPLMRDYLRVRFRGDTLSISEMQEIRSNLRWLKEEVLDKKSRSTG
ncbi:MAG: transglutaminase-like domain-containing protein, partial [Planctomycetaceae bacterium]|nr:transglutaminase-like domain-containing protein [Planctomycetaceae bacterium]